MNIENAARENASKLECDEEGSLYARICAADNGDSSRGDRAGYSRVKKGRC